MNIWDIANKSGFSSKHIDFYEKQGLLSPKFDDYGCRIFSEDDLEALLRIKLFRMLGISVNIISLLEKKEIELSNVLDGRIYKPETNIKVFEIQNAVCKAIMEDGVTYSEIDAQKYLALFEELMDGTSTPRIFEEELIHTVKHPWRRYFARSVDIGAYSIIWYFILYVVIGTYPIKNNFVLFLISFVVFAMMIFIEPLLLSKFGTTFGKWIFGLYIRDLSDFKPSYSMALKRTWGVFAKGYGFNIPIYDIVRNIKCYKTCNEGNELPWEDGFVYAIRDTKTYRAFLYIAVAFTIYFANYYLVQYAELPNNRGEISAEEFAENFNDFMDYVSAGDNVHLKSDGTFEKDPNTIVIEIYQGLPKQYEIIEENGVVTSVSFEVESKDMMIASSNAEMMACVMSYVAAQPEMNIFKLRSEKIMNNFKDRFFQSFEFTSAGINVSCKVEHSGYYQGNNYLVANEGEDNYYHLVFKMEKID